MASDRIPHATGEGFGRPRTRDLRETVNAIPYVLRSGCPWRLLPKDFPPRLTVQRYFALWRDGGLWTRLNHHLLMAARERGFDAGKKVK